MLHSANHAWPSTLRNSKVLVGVKRTNESSNICLKIGKENERSLIFLVRTTKCTCMYMTVWFLVPTSCVAEGAQFDNMREH